VAEPTPEQQTDGQSQGRRRRRVAEPAPEQHTERPAQPGGRRVPLDRVNAKLAAQLAAQLADAAQQIAMLQVLAEDLQEENDKLRAELVAATGAQNEEPAAAG
jgi:hypothetical protein